MIGTSIATADRPHRVTLQSAGPAAPVGGGYQQTWIDLAPPAISVKIQTATAEVLERVAAGAIVTTATHIISGPFHPQVTNKSRVLYNGQIFSVTGVTDVDMRHVDMVLVCVEVVP